MHDIINRLRAKKDDEGFTLIELLVVVVIIGVLVAIAVPVYLNYRQGAADKAAESDVRGAISAVEQFYTNNSNQYPASALNKPAPSFTLPAIGGGTAGTVTVSDGTTLSVYNVNASTYRICAKNSGGTTNRFFVYDNSNGGSISPVTSTTFSLNTCA